MVAVTICSDFGAQKIKPATVSTVFPPICHEVMGPDAMILVNIVTIINILLGKRTSCTSFGQIPNWEILSQIAFIIKALKPIPNEFSDWLWLSPSHLQTPSFPPYPVFPFFLLSFPFYFILFIRISQGCGSPMIWQCYPFLGDRIILEYNGVTNC